MWQDTRPISRRPHYSRASELGREAQHVESAGALRDLPQLPKEAIGERKMAMMDQLQIIKQLREGPGETVAERTDAVLTKYGWNHHLAKIGDEDFRAVVRAALEHLALRNAPRQNARDIEKERHKRETEKIAASGKLGDLFDQYVGLSPDALAANLPRESYWVESLGRRVAREDLAFELGAVAELRAQAHAALVDLEREANVHRHELAIFDELLRQSSESRRRTSSLESVD